MRYDEGYGDLAIGGFRSAPIIITRFFSEEANPKIQIFKRGHNDLIKPKTKLDKKGH